MSASAPATPVTAAGQQEETKLITTLPSYFPLQHKECAEVSETFFKCFETEAQMKHAKDAQSCKTALVTCQKELLGYMQCMDTNYVQKRNKNKVWWKVW